MCILYIFSVKQNQLLLEMSLHVKHLPSTHKALGIIPNLTTKQNKTKTSAKLPIIPEADIGKSQVQGHPGLPETLCHIYMT
jgi:hypothetical protein